MKQKNESGRSLVELIGVLCIMGVLSIGSLLAYDYTRARTQYTSIVETGAKLLAVARIKGRIASTFSEQMSNIALQRDKALISAEIVEGDGIIKICVCERDKEKQEIMRVRISEIAGLNTSEISAYSGTEFYKKYECKEITDDCFCADKKEPFCFSLTYKDLEQ